MAQISAGDLRSRVTVLRRVKTKNALGEDDYTYEPEEGVGQDRPHHRPDGVPGG